MGFNTAVMVLNDGLDWIEKDTEVGKKLALAIMTADRLGGDVSSGGYHAVMQALPSQHADYVQIVAIGGNCIRPLGGSFRWEPEDLLRDLANQMGFTLRRKPGSPTTKGSR